ncbi:MAG TPA: hypothetical protein VN688_07795 [Gemmataceae bacterium]|nr:hypothetical protein [Gemmataceae bacterium]
MTQPNDMQHASAHAPEPWEHHGNCLIYGQCSGDDDDDEAPFVADVCNNPNVYTEQERANARRIVAAVNACKGISTEALERGVITELRHVLGELLTTAGDLDAALDGATDQFNAEHTKLAPALHAAQAVLDGGMALDMHELLASRRKIAAIWCMEDVLEVRPDLTEKQAWEVLEQVERRRDATIGITWDTLEMVAEDLFGSAPKSDSQD